MKRIYLIIIFSLFAVSVFSQAAKLEVSPATVDVFTSPVTFIFDVTGTAMEGQDEAYLWSWSPQASDPSEMFICGSSWGAILPSAKLQKMEGEDNKYILALPYTTTIGGEEKTFTNLASLFSASPGKLKEIGFLIRNLDGSKQTDGDLKTSLKLASLVFEDKVFRSFPSAISVKDVTTVYLNQYFAEDLKVKIMEDVKLMISFIDNEGEVIGEMDEYVTPKQESTRVWSYTFLPDKLGILQEGKFIADVVKMKVKFKGTLNKPDGSKEDVEKEFEQDFKLYE